MQLSKSNKFQQEYTHFFNKINKITDKAQQGELIGLLNSLVAEIHIVDQRHQELIGNPKIAADINDKRNSILALRKKITTRLTDCERAGLIPKD
jgi:hypothetical protein